MFPENETTDRRLERISQTFIDLSRSSFSLDKQVVQAAGILHENSTTEIINVNILSQRITSVIQNVCSTSIHIEYKKIYTYFVLIKISNLSNCQNF